MKTRIDVRSYSRRKSLAQIEREVAFEETTRALRQYVADKKQRNFAEIARDWIKGIAA